MMNFTVKSKVYITPKKKNYFFLIVLNICIVIVAILSLLSIFGDGVKVGNVSPIIIGLFVVIRSRTWLKSEPYYEFSMARITLDKDVCISYDIGQEVTIYTDSITNIEYSDQLECLRFVADYTVTINNKSITHNQDEFLFYIVAQDNQEFLMVLEQQTRIEVCYVDRNTKK